MTTRFATTLAPVMLAVAVGGLLTACGGDDSSASSTPSLTSSATAAATTTTATSTSAAPSGSTTTSASASTSPGAAATAPDESDPVPSGFPGPTSVPISPRGTAFLDALKGRGVTVAGTGDIAVGTAEYICAAQSEGVADDQVLTFVTANVGAEASASGTQITAEDAAKTAQVYVDVARSTYCG
ncbi:MULTISPECIES: DUF732 domain-containing protein [unclassified Rhodococcus]|uniref:DUF732 domain-containing protein n=1 Tax=unclassified Rhodococcus (in: high G+C Gram-positive bacteria) TaxID=192944 RepID=UPI0009E68495